MKIKTHLKKSFQLFGHRVEMLRALGLSKRLDVETCYKNIKIELKQLKKARKKVEKK